MAGGGLLLATFVPFPLLQGRALLLRHLTPRPVVTRGLFHWMTALHEIESQVANAEQEENGARGAGNEKEGDKLSQELQVFKAVKHTDNANAPSLTAEA
ncbi:hypothetical protein UY3_09713 [Chelonia mydas]|uniref:Uncharacterized protein n=1 Tax=Chelonia mydas TaxID=8469 RepID=M7B5C6_CHEMY|nr:hypothetical protein UY3_09713 [Chelonia mydas]